MLESWPQPPGSPAWLQSWGHRDAIHGVWASMGALFPPSQGRIKEGTGQTLGMSQVPYRLALSSSSSFPALLLAGLLPLAPHLGPRPSPRGSSLAWGHAAAAWSAPPNPKHFVRVEVSLQHDSALRSWASFPPGPALLSQLSCPVTPHLGSTLPGPCPSLPLPFLHVLYRPGPNSNPPILQK